MKKNEYISPAIQMIIVSATHMIASSLDNSSPTNISGITNGGTASDQDEAGVKVNSYSVWEDDWSR